MTKKNSNKNPGWYGESKRHSLARRGIKTTTDPYTSDISLSEPRTELRTPRISPVTGKPIPYKYIKEMEEMEDVETSKMTKPRKMNPNMPRKYPKADRVNIEKDVSEYDYVLGEDGFTYFKEDGELLGVSQTEGKVFKYDPVIGRWVNAYGLPGETIAYGKIPDE
jgi:hypothetical protein